MVKVMFDTNFYNDLSAQYPQVVETFLNYAAHNATFIMPTIIMYEILSYSKYDTDEITKKLVDKFIELSKGNIIDLTLEIAGEAAGIRRFYRIKRNKRLKAPDAIIATTAKLNGAILISNNYDDTNMLLN